MSTPTHPRAAVSALINAAEIMELVAGKYDLHEEAVNALTECARDSRQAAHIESAAPDLLAACRLMLEAECRNGYAAAMRERDPETLDEHHAVYLNALDAIGKAIAKAEGRA